MSQYHTAISLTVGSSTDPSLSPISFCPPMPLITTQVYRCFGISVLVVISVVIFHLGRIFKAPENV